MPRETVSAVTQEIGGPVNDFCLTSLDGVQVRLRTLLENKMGAVIVFWSGICSHCVRYDAYLNAFAILHPELGFVAIASRQQEPPSQLRATANARELSFPILLDPGAQVAEHWFTRQTPRAFLVDAGGLLRYRGAIDNYRYPNDIEYMAYLEPAIAQFLSGSQLTRTETAGFGCAIRSVYYNFPKAL